MELLELSPVAFEVLKPQDRHSSVPCDEVQHVGQLVLAQPRHVLPEPHDERVGGRAVGVDGVLLEVLDIDDLPPIDDDIQLMRLEDLQQLGRNDLIQPVLQALQQFADALAAVIVHPTSYISYIRPTYSSLFVEFTIMSNPFSLSGMVICVPCSSNS